MKISRAKYLVVRVARSEYPPAGVARVAASTAPPSSYRAVRHRHLADGRATMGAMKVTGMIYEDVLYGAENVRGGQASQGGGIR